MIDVQHSVLLVLVIAVITYALRAAPFVLLGHGKEIPSAVSYLGKVLPYAIIGMLVVYCLKGVSLVKAPFGLPELIAGTLVAVLHVWKRSTLLSVGAGTVCYMLLVQLVF